MIAIVQHDHHRVGHPRLIWAIRLGVLALILLGAWWFHAQVGTLARGPSMQRVRLLSPQAEAPPPEPDKPEPQPEEKLDKQEADPNQPFDASAPQAPGEPGSLGVDSEGDAGADNFGLAAKPGGRELTTYPEGSGYGIGQGGGGGGGVARSVARLNDAFVGLYMRRIGTRLEDQLARRDDLRRQAWHAVVTIIIDEKGIVRSAEVLPGVEPRLAGRLHDVLVGLDTGEAPLRAGREIKVIIRSKMESNGH
jgi:hypothetical protein